MQIYLIHTDKNGYLLVGNISGNINFFFFTLGIKPSKFYIFFFFGGKARTKHNIVDKFDV